MEAVDVMKLLMHGSVACNSKYAVLGETSASSGTMINNLSSLIPDPLTIYQLRDGVLFELNQDKISSYFTVSDNFMDTISAEAALNKFIYKTDIIVLDLLCGLLKNGGLQSLTKYLKDTEDITDMHDMAYLIVLLILDYNFCNYPQEVKNKLNAIIDKGTVAKGCIEELRVDFLSHTCSSDTFKAIAYDLYSYDMLGEDEANMPTFADGLNKLGVNIGYTSFASDDARSAFIASYIAFMLNRKVFGSVYAKQNTFCYNIGCCLNNDNYKSEFDGVVCPGYKLSIADMANTCIRVNAEAAIYVKGIFDQDVAVDLKEITSFTAKEMLKSGMTSDGADSVIFQHILYYK